MTQSHLIACLARHLLRTYRIRADIEAFLARWEANHGKASADKLREALNQEREARRENSRL